MDNVWTPTVVTVVLATLGTIVRSTLMTVHPTPAVTMASVSMESTPSHAAVAQATLELCVKVYFAAC